MTESLFPAYERELIYLRQLVEEFAGRHRVVAQRLGLEPTRSTDPHVERLLQTFALLAARVQRRLDDTYPEVSGALLDVLYPHFRAPLPSRAIVQMDLDPARTMGYRVPRHSPLRASGGDVSCRYQTVYPVPLWPVRVTAASLQPPPFATFAPGVAPAGAAAVLRLRVECAGPAKFSALKDFDTLRLFLDGDDAFVALLYEYLFQHALHVVYRPRDAAGADVPALMATPAAVIAPVGFGPDEGLLPYPPAAAAGVRLLTEFFAFPAKFHFVDLGGFARVGRAGFDKVCEVAIFLGRTHRRLEQGVEAATFRLGCTPVVNLFQPSPIALPAAVPGTEYPLRPDPTALADYEVYRVDAVQSKDPTTGASTTYAPYHSARHDQSGDPAAVYWTATRHPAERENDAGTDVALTLVDLALNPRPPREPVLHVQTTCTNRDRPARLAAVGTAVKFELEAAAPLAGLHCLHAPTPTGRPARGRGADWRLLSHLTLNHLSLADGSEGLEALHEILRLYAPLEPGPGGGSGPGGHLVEGLVGVRHRRVIGRLADEVGTTFGRGLEVSVEFDDDKLGGAGTYLFTAVLERFLARYVVSHSFCQLVTRSRQAGEQKRWPPRAGELAAL